jgi:hypothetical protein
MTALRDNSEGLVPRDRRPPDHYSRQFVAADGLPPVVPRVVWAKVASANSGRHRWCARVLRIAGAVAIV